MSTLYRQLHGSKTHAQGNDPACPVCVRHIKLADVLHDIGAKQLSIVEGPNGADMAFYGLPSGGTLIIQRYPKDTGFEVYCPVTRSNLMADTLVAIRAYAAGTTAVPAPGPADS